jgi:serine protease AprX
VLTVIALAVATPVVAAASSSGPSQHASARAFISPGLARAAKENPGAKVSVIVESSKGASAAAHALREGAGSPKRTLDLVNAVAGQIPAARLDALRRNPNVTAITEDAPVRLSGYSNIQQWPQVTGLATSFDFANTGAKMPTIAIVDSGIDATRADFGSRIVAQVNMTNLIPNAPGDGRGHGTFVAGIAAGGAPGYAGAAPTADIVSIDVMDDKGMAMTSDVIAAAQWIYDNRGTYNIRVANFSLHSTVPASFMFDPLDKAVEKLWFAGVVVVVAAGNYGVNGQPSGVPYAPGNDPFVITVGASDTTGTVGANDDLNTPWSAYGYTLDGFFKPEIGAPGRFMIGPVPAASTLVAEFPTRMSAPGYMQLSGTSFAAPLVAGAASFLLAKHPGWTPDQVKGALMLYAKPVPNAAARSLGVGELAVASISTTTPPNPNLALSQFVISDPAGGSGRVFDAASWASRAQADASWASASWASASWSTASWASASWASASWSSASWASASWASQASSDQSWADASWGSASWASKALEDGAIGDFRPAGAYLFTP